MELAIAAGLRPLAPEHRSHAPHPQPVFPQQPVRYHGPHDARGGLRAQCDVIFTLVDEAEHFLFDDIGEIADGTIEQLSLLDDRYAKFFVPVTREYFARDAFQML